MFSFWVIPRRLGSKTQRLGTLYLFHLQGQVPLKMEPIEGSETPGHYPKENILHKERGESLKLKKYFYSSLL
jgi:hypothetical protein